MRENNRSVLDSYAALSFFYGESGAERVRTLLRAAKKGKAKLWMSWVNAGEVYYALYRNQGNESAERALSLLKTYPIMWVEVTEKNIFLAAKFKALYPIAYADCFAAAVALQHNATLLTGNPEFKELEGKISIEWL
ncbi:MAG: type II toxin-antitoxin system VapC family toxin [Pseudomonadota bacterium]